MQVHFCPEGATVIIHDTPKRSATMPNREGQVRLNNTIIIFCLWIVVLVCVILYVVPRTAVLGAILLTGYLGGAVATHLRVGDPLFSHTLSPVYFAVLLWGGLYLRDERLRALIPLRS